VAVLARKLAQGQGEVQRIVDAVAEAVQREGTVLRMQRLA
jgi:hypothetical protein